MLYHEAATGVGLEDSIKGAPGEPTVFEGEDLGYIPQTVLVVARASYDQRCLRVI